MSSGDSEESITDTEEEEDLPPLIRIKDEEGDPPGRDSSDQSLDLEPISSSSSESSSKSSSSSSSSSESESDSEEEEKQEPSLQLIQRETLEEGSLVKEFTDHPAFERQGHIGQEEMHWRRELEPIKGNWEEKRWISVRKRHEEGHQAFRIARKSAKKDAYVELEDSSPLVQTEATPPPAVNISDRKIGWEPGKGPVKGSNEWDGRQQFWWREEAKRMLSKIPRKGWSKKLWDWTEQNRAYHCAYFEIPFIKYPWPGDRGELVFDPRTVPENQETISEMIAKNPAFKEGLGRMLEEWLHPESMEERLARIEQERRDLEEMRRRMEAQRIIDVQGPSVELREQGLGKWMAQIEEDERQRMETPSEKRTRERRQEIGDHRHFLKQDGRFHGIVRTVRFFWV
jgi:hypothetical protein